ncbi:GDPD5: Glycerophosphodiester phosphodiesterase domain containing 5 [Crotalus adamanteus]|uniref:GDPD5: Glycerophosphodiester phosphodiesterase domain containing 5 n=1 Tax=Crotalus adamanteus TaxID=8729 RepID=A0AAW1BL73_CROAD
MNCTVINLSLFCVCVFVSSQWERLWFLFLTFSFFLTLVWFYFWWEVHNDYNEINWFLYNRMGYWSDWSIPILVTTAAGFTYITALLILALCHIAVGQQMNLHWIHKVGLGLFRDSKLL